MSMLYRTIKKMPALLTGCARLAAGRVPILKQIAAFGGQRVCIRKAVVYVDGTGAAPGYSTSTAKAKGAR
jgi:type IV secretory pathway protease TraF